MTNSVFADALRPTSRARALAYDLALVLGASLLIALCAQVAISNPVPITGQTLAVLLVGAALGSKRGALAVAAYLAEGLAGLPVFARGGLGPAHLLGPTGGYLLGFLVAAYLVGALAERGWDRKLGSTALAMVLGNLAIYAVGLPWLAVYAQDSTLAVGLYPFLVGDAIKVAVAAGLLPSAWKLMAALGS